MPIGLTGVKQAQVGNRVIQGNKTSGKDMLISRKTKEFIYSKRKEVHVRNVILVISCVLFVTDLFETVLK